MVRNQRKQRMADDPGMDITALAVLLLAGAIGVALISIGVWLDQVKKLHVPGSLSTHFGGALVVAGVMGVTYELLMDRRRHRQHEQQIDDIKNAVLQSISGLTQFSAPQLLALLQDVARSLDRTPTLFPPARTDSECPFSSSPEYFDTIIGSAKADMLEFVASWLRDSNENLRFLASDFVGKYRIEKFADEMRRAADAEWLGDRWNQASEKTKQWVLNYYWALSALDDNELQTLRGLLVTAPDSFTRKWILHVPLQMPEMKGVERLVEDFLERTKPAATNSGRMSMTPDEAHAVIRALAAIERHDREQKREAEGRGVQLLRKYRDALGGYRSYTAKAWVGMHLAPADLPMAESARTGKVVARETDSMTVQYGDGEQAKVRIVRPAPVIPEDDNATIVGITDASGAFQPLYAQLAKGVLAPILHAKE